ncbi:Ig-like domain repeat protein [Spirillospora sp. NPDC052269]
MTVCPIGGRTRAGSTRGRSRVWGVLAAATALLMVVCVIAGPAAARRPSAAAPPTSFAFGTGENSAGQLGNGSTNNSTSPARVALPEGVTVTHIVGRGNGHSVALTSDGRLLAWGSNLYGQLGDGTDITRTTPVFVELPDGVTITQVAAGRYYTLALTSEGSILAWGNNDQGQLGDGTTTPRDTPAYVELPDGVTVSQVSGGEYHSLAVTSDGRVLAWGRNYYGTLGDGTTTQRLTPVYVHLPDGVTVDQVTASTTHSAAVTSDGRVLAWGNNENGQLGDGTLTQRNSPVFSLVPAGVTVTQATTGDTHTLALTAGGRVLAWGGNTYGQLGIGSTAGPQTTPVDVDLPDGVTVTQVAGGWAHNVALTSDGRVLAWGRNAFGQLGDNSTNQRNSPVYMNLPGYLATEVAAGFQHSLLLAEPITSSTSLTADPTEATAGQPVRLTATVTCSAGTPGGAVYFYLNGDTFLDSAPVEPDGTATFTIALGEGEHQITALYGGDGNCPRSTSEPVTVTVRPVVSPALTMTKSADRTTFSAAGEAIVYSYRVTNTGDAPLTDVGISDALPGLSEITCAETTLAPGQGTDCSATYTTTSEDVRNGSVRNVATAHGTPEGATTPIESSPAGATVSLRVPPAAKPAIRLRKSVRPAHYSAVGQVLHFGYRVTNTGNVALQHVRIDDRLRGLSAIRCPKATLAPGRSMTCTATYRIRVGDVRSKIVRNRATAQGTPPGSSRPVTSRPSVARAYGHVPVTG